MATLTLRAGANHYSNTHQTTHCGRSSVSRQLLWAESAINLVEAHQNSEGSVCCLLNISLRRPDTDFGTYAQSAEVWKLAAIVLKIRGS